MTQTVQEFEEATEADLYWSTHSVFDKELLLTCGASTRGRQYALAWVKDDNLGFTVGTSHAVPEAERLGFVVSGSHGLKV